MIGNGIGNIASAWSLNSNNSSHDGGVNGEQISYEVDSADSGESVNVLLLGEITDSASRQTQMGSARRGCEYNCDATEANTVWDNKSNKKHKLSNTDEDHIKLNCNRPNGKINDNPRLLFMKSLMPAIDEMSDDDFMDFQIHIIEELTKRRSRSGQEQRST